LGLVGSSLSAAPAVRPTWLALDRNGLEVPRLIAETDSIEQAITLLETHRTESIMSLQTTLFAAVAALAFSAAAQAAPQPTVKLERVVVTGKAVREIAQLPRVVVIGYSEATLARQTLAAAKTNVKRG
jgi:hypothetical protein